MRKYLSRPSVRLFYRLMLVLLICMLPVCGLSLVSNFREQQMLKQAIINSQKRNASYYLRLLEQEVARLQDITYAYMNDDDFKSLAVMYDHLSDYGRVETIGDVRQKLQHIRQISPYAANLYLYLPSLGRSLNALNTDYELDREEVLWYLRQEDRMRPLYNEHGQLMVCACFPTSATVDRLPAMMLKIEVDAKQIRGILSEAADGAMLVGKEWEIWTDAGSPAEMEGFDALKAQFEAEPEGAETMRWMGESCLGVWRYSSQLKATLLTYLPESDVLGDLEESRRLLWMLLFAAVVMLTGTAIGVYHMVHRPMRRLVTAFQEVENGNNDVRLTVKSTDEFRYLYSRFNQMMDRLNGLIQQVYIQRILSQQAQLKQLQMQINPHFFYNSFFAIRGMLEMGDVETAERMLGCIGSYFRYITRSARDTVPMKDEVAHARDYCAIQQIRFENIEVAFEALPEPMAEFEVPRLILQPLIENAYMHGLESMEVDGWLRVGFEDGPETVCVRVSDNGGVSEERLEAVRRNLTSADPGEITGMVNIHRRLKLFYGEAAGLDLARNADGGLTLTITMPKEAKHRVQAFDR